MSPQNPRDIIRQVVSESEAELETYVPDRDRGRYKDLDYGMRNTKKKRTPDNKYPSPQEAVQAFNDKHATDLTVEDCRKMLLQTLRPEKKRTQKLPSSLKATGRQVDQTPETCPVRGCRKKFQFQVAITLANKEGKRRQTRQSMDLHLIGDHPSRDLHFDMMKLMELLFPQTAKKKTVSKKKAPAKKRRTSRK